MSIIGEVNGKKRNHTALILEGICTHCCYCGMPLTDAISVERGIGPICSKKGYEEEVKDADIVDAMIVLSPWEKLTEYVVSTFGPKGTARDIMNCLVRLASLNRKNYDFFVSAAAAIEALGYTRLAAALRESISIITVKKNEGARNLTLQIKKYAYRRSFGSRLRNIPGCAWSHQLRGYIVPIGTPENPNTVTLEDGRTVSVRAYLWDAMIGSYEGYFAKIEKDGVKDYHGVRIGRKSA